jgi:2-polyprenyl-6-methoxyphenol hydroxylase-like FAD-dependent oxidoreductase
MNNRAVVLGASVAGLLAAKALAETYPEVVVVERDELASEVTGAPRRGVPQGRHVHGLLVGGLRAIEELLPGFAEALVARGAIHFDAFRYIRFCGPNGRIRQPEGDERALAVSRPLLEGQVLAMLRAAPQVRILDRTDVIGPRWHGAGRRTRVDGVRVCTAGEAETVIDADIVVDATGRGSRTPVWLAEAGFAKPAEQTVKVDIAYTTRLFQVDRSDLDGDVTIVSVPSPQQPRGGVLSLQENGVGLLTLYGLLGESAPTDLDGFLEFSRTLITPDISEALTRLRPIGDGQTFRFPASVRRRYESLRRFPAGLVVIGDAVCSFNPAYGQGMSVAAKQAVVLRRLARAGETIDARRFFRQIAAILETPWQIVVGGDLSHPAVEGERTAMLRLLNRYLNRLQRAATRDLVLAESFNRVMHLIAAPPTLMRPDRALRVLIGGRRRVAGEAPRPA